MRGQVNAENRIGVDVGGTFTDFVIWHGGRLEVKKLPTSQPQSVGVAEGAASFGVPLSEIGSILHGTTVGTNALLERRGGPAALLITRGFGDLLEIQRGDRARLYDLHWRKPVPLLGPPLVAEITERIDADGNVVVPLDEQAALAVINELVSIHDVTSIGVCFLFSYLDNSHELKIAELIAEHHPDVSVSLSHQVAPEWREYERASTVAVNSYLVPPMTGYLRDLGGRLAERGFARDYFVMQSNGGMVTSRRAVEIPCTTVMSGPSAGVEGAAAIGRLAGIDDFLTLDMGGTSTDICLVEDGRPTITAESDIEGLPLKVRSVAIRAIGSGGGSIATVESGGRLRVGPESAGSRPGPACYGLGGTAATISDASVVTGFLSAEADLGGSVTVQPELARAAVGEVAEQLDLTVEETALAIIELAADSIMHACRGVSVERGRDPRQLALVAFGGAGPMFACRVAEELEIGKVVIPPFPGVTSALGLLVSPVRQDVSLTAPNRGDLPDEVHYRQVYAKLEEGVIETLVAEGFDRDDVRVARTVQGRYRGQTHEVDIEVPDGEIDADLWASVHEAFHKAHQDRFGFAMREREIEFVTCAVSATITLPQAPLSPPGSGAADGPPAPIGHRPVHFRSGVHDTPVFHRSDLAVGSLVEGPAIIVQEDTTTVITPGFVARTDDHLNLILTKEAAA